MRRIRLVAGGLAATLSISCAFLAFPATAHRAPTPFPTVGAYNGTTHPADALVSWGLACNVIAGQLTCYDTQAEADAAGAAEVGKSLNGCSPHLTVWAGSGFTGNALNYYSSGWTNLPASWRNTTSSWRSGCRAGRLSDFVNGGGNSIGLPAGGSDGTMPTGWNDRADAVYRY